MPKTIKRWLLYEYVDAESTPLSKLFKTKQLAEKSRFDLLESRQVA
jgi:hypothetical protein